MMMIDDFFACDLIDGIFNIWRFFLYMLYVIVFKLKPLCLDFILA